MQGVSNPRGLLRVTWSDKWALLKEYNVFLNYFIDGRGTATPGTHTNWLNMLWKGQFGLHFPFLRYLHLKPCWEAWREVRWGGLANFSFWPVLPLHQKSAQNLFLLLYAVPPNATKGLFWKMLRHTFHLNTIHPFHLLVFIFIFPWWCIQSDLYGKWHSK